MDAAGDLAEVVVIEGSEAMAQEVGALLAGSGAFNPHLLAPDRPLMAPPDWIGPALLLIGLDEDRAERLAYARRVQGAYPGAIIIGYTANYTADVFAEGISAGARRILRYPFEIRQLEQAINDVREELRTLAPVVQRTIPPAVETPTVSAAPALVPTRENQIITLFSPKGGVGTSTLAVNLSVALQILGQPTVLVDGNISFGSADVFLELQPTQSMLQLVGDVDQLSDQMILATLIGHSSGLKVLLAPLRPEEGDTVRREHIQRILAGLKRNFRFTVVDTWPSYDDRVLAVLEMADLVLVPFGPDLPTMKLMTGFLRVARLLNYDMDKIVPVLMRSNSVPPGDIKSLEAFLNQPLRWRVVSDGKRATAAANTGTPFVLSARDAQISQNVFELAKFLIGSAEKPADSAKNKPRLQAGGLFRRR
jgi:pilus assembly protein CpaE